MRRRQFVAALPLASGFAGCVGGSSRFGATETRSPAPDEPVQTTLRSSYRYGVNDDAIGVSAPEHAQFAFVRPPDTDTDHPTDAYTLEIGSERFAPATSVSGFMSWTPDVDSVYTDERRSGALRFDVPRVEADSAALLRDGRRWPLDESTRERLPTAPDLGLDSIDIPESVEPNERFELGVTVTNDGDRTGTFLAGFRTGGLPKTVEVEVDPGDTGAGSATFEAYDGEGEIPFAYSGPGESRRVAVDIVAGTETSHSATSGSGTDTP
ncbi:hypothetical protein [Halosimplex salinum]|uniref:hypothetical protein n=1 Tax=Halosimplex salinum TaxID=1710538 RepID=UPI000F482517|nr:hypothetical protein [Halosimplex salinum]